MLNPFEERITQKILEPGWGEEDSRLSVMLRVSNFPQTGESGNLTFHHRKPASRLRSMLDHFVLWVREAGLDPSELERFVRKEIPSRLDQAMRDIDRKPPEP